MLQKVCANWPQKLFKGGPANTLSDMHITRPLFMYKLTKSFSLYSLLIFSSAQKMQFLMEIPKLITVQIFDILNVVNIP